jgi:crossover junction endodeoxyribonuclease RusA
MKGRAGQDQDLRQPREDAPGAAESNDAGMGDGEKASEGLLGPQRVTFRVEGMEAAPQGSKRHVGRGIMIESCKQVRPWRNMVAAAAIDADAPLIRGPVSMSVEFLFMRPKSHFRANGTLKPSAPTVHAVKPDGSKLIRSTEDALSKLVFEDDSRIHQGSWLKRYCNNGERPGAIITILQHAKTLE